MLFKPAVALLLLTVGCGRCGSSFEGGGVTPYVRCLAADPPSFPQTLGALRLSVSDRVLEIEGLPAEPRVAVFQGPGMATSAAPNEVVGALARQKPDLLLMLGGIGSDPKNAAATLHPIAKQGIPLLFLAGGRDTSENVTAARDLLPTPLGAQFIDLTSLVALRTKGYLWLLVAGAAAGREGIDEAACGFAEDDLGARLDLGRDVADGTKRVLVSWEIPTGVLGSTSPTAPAVGSDALAKLRTELGDIAGIHAWPDLHVMRPYAGGNVVTASDQPRPDLQLVVPRVTGPAHVRGDGTRQLPGFAIVRFAEGGLIAEPSR